MLLVPDIETVALLLQCKRFACRADRIDDVEVETIIIFHVHTCEILCTTRGEYSLCFFNRSRKFQANSLCKYYCMTDGHSSLNSVRNVIT